MDKRYATRLNKYERFLQGMILVELRKYYRDCIDNLKDPSKPKPSRPDFKAKFTRYALLMAVTESEIEFNNQELYGSSYKIKAIGWGSLRDIVLRLIEPIVTIQYTLLVDGIVNSTERSIINAFKGDVSNDDAISDLEDRYEKKLKPWAYNSAVTEAGTIVNAARYITSREYYESQGRSAEKKYITREDEKVRHSHEQLANTVIPIDSDFHFETRDGGVEFALYPCSNSLSLPNKLGCRCTVIYAGSGILTSE